ncbi:MAG: hypothetical protein JWO36_4674 [Myxococcales bacterium]|nr:hypothetical protein [Myxococcales bacterium]
MSKRFRILCVALGATVGCATSHSNRHDDAGVGSDSQTIDAATHVTPSAQLTPAGGRMSGGVYHMDVQIGQPFSQQPTSATGKTFETNTAVKP